MKRESNGNDQNEKCNRKENGLEARGEVRGQGTGSGTMRTGEQTRPSVSTGECKNDEQGLRGLWDSECRDGWPLGVQGPRRRESEGGTGKVSEGL